LKALLLALKAARHALDAAIREIEGTPDRVIRIGRAELNCGARSLRIGRREIFLTPTGMRILWTLVKRRGEVCTRDDILAEVWGHEYGGTTRSIDTQIRILRKIIEPDPANPKHIVTVHGHGYRMTGDA